jgi:glucokinase
MKEAKYAIGIGLNLFDARAILLREDAKIIAQVERKRKEVSAEGAIRILVELVDEILNKSTKYKKDIIGVGLALGGVVDKRKGVVYWPQRQDSSCVYISVPFKRYLEERFKFPIFMENDANACAWAEYIQHYKKYENIIYMFSGVGCGIILRGALYTGKDGGAGEFFLTPRANMKSTLGDFSFFSQWPQDLGVVKRAKELISRGRPTSLIKRIDSTGSLSLEDVFLEARNKDKLSREILKEAALCLGARISFLINLLNPEVIIVGGGFEEAGDFFLEEVLKAIRKFSFSALRKNLKVVFSNLGREAPSLGVAHLIFKEKRHTSSDIIT